MPDDHDFYANIPSSKKSLIALLNDERSFFTVPSSWDVVVTDIEGSTRAVREGKYREVNLVAVSCLVSALNIARKRHIQIPFFFGGDGATMLCPPTMTDELMCALQLIQRNAEQNFELTLRVGKIRVEEVCQTGDTIKLGKVRIATGYDQAVCLGDGLLRAEKIIKSRIANKSTESTSTDESPPLQGLECRWREIAAPTINSEIVSFIISSSASHHQATVFVRVLELIETIYGTHNTRHPVRKEHLSLVTTYAEIKKELMIRYSAPPLLSVLKTIFDVGLATILFKFNIVTKLFDPILYKQQLIAATDSLKIDGMLKTTMQGSSAQREQLIAALTALEKKHQLKFGYYVTDATVMTCYVADRNAGHVHFLDAKGGGYTQAATMLKQKFAV